MMDDGIDTKRAGGGKRKKKKRNGKKIHKIKKNTLCIKIRNIMYLLSFPFVNWGGATQDCL